LIPLKVSPVTTLHIVDVLVYPSDCDASGRVGHPSFVDIFERVRWQVIASGPGLEVFSRNQAWPAVRKATIEYYRPALVGDVLEIETSLTHHGRTSFTLHQMARRPADRQVVAEGEFLFVCLGESDGRPAHVPPEISRFFGTRPSVRPGGTQHIDVKGLTTATDIQGDGPAVLFVHGFPLDRTMWRHLISTLTGWRRIAPDLRGMGLTDVPGDGYTLGQYADDLAGLLDVLGIDQTVFCGHSMGGYIGFEMMRRHPDRIRALILANTRPTADDAAGKTVRDDMIATVDRDGTAVLPDLLVPKLLGPSSLAALPRVVEHLRTMIAGTPARGVIGALTAMRDRPDSTPSLATIEVPTLVIAGTDDQLIPLRECKAYAKDIPGAQFTPIPEAGHLAPMEQPIAMSRVMAEFLEAL
jgi:YbgC/YbaW family acyl-CoA thioester hydrolase